MNTPARWCILALSLSLPGCALFTSEPEILAQPEPDYPLVVERPVLAIHQLVQDKGRVVSPDELAKAYAVTVLQLIHYAEQLEKVVQHYQPDQPENSVSGEGE